MAFNLASIFGTNLADAFKEIVGTFKLDPAKKAEFQAAIDAGDLEIRKKEMDLQLVIEDHLNKEIESRKDIIVAEMQQGDRLTKWARPMIVYAGLFFVFLNNVLPAIIQYCGGRIFTPVSLPDRFWDAWEVVVSVWAVGRTVEKVGYGNKLTKMITGSK